MLARRNSTGIKYGHDMRKKSASHCHPDRKYYSKNLCKRCYDASWKEENPDKAIASREKYHKAHPGKAKAENAAWIKANTDSVNARNAAWRKANPDKVRAANSAYQEANPDKVNANTAKYVKANPEKTKARHAKYQEENYDKIKVSGDTWRKANPGKVNAQTAKRRAKKLQATPPWLTKEQLKEIKEFYILAKELQWLSDPTDPLEVDHIEPFLGENVCGLHVPWNLQILPKSMNCRKGNRRK